MFKLLIEIKQEINKLLDEDFINLQTYHQQMGREYKIPEKVKSQIKKWITPPTEFWDDGNEYDRQEKMASFRRKVLAPLKEQFENSLGDITIQKGTGYSRRSIHLKHANISVQEIILEIETLQKQNTEKQNAATQKNQEKIKGLQVELAPILIKIDELTTEKQNIKTPEILEEVESRLAARIAEKEKLETEIKSLEEWIPADEKIENFEGQIVKLKDLAKKLSPYYDLTQLSMRQIQEKEESHLTYLLDLLKGELPKTYLEARLKKVQALSQPSLPPANWKEILSEIIKNDEQVKLGVAVDISSSHRELDIYNFTYIIGENDGMKYTFIENQLASVRNSIHAFRLAALQALAANVNVIFDGKEVIFKIAKRTALKLIFTQLKDRNNKGKRIFLNTTGTEQTKGYGNTPNGIISLGGITPSNQPNGFIFEGLGYSIEASFFSAYLLVNENYV